MTSGTRHALQLLLAIILASSILYVHLFVPGRGNGADFAVFYAAAVTDAHGGDPYLAVDTWRTQRALFYPPGYSGPPHPDTNRNPPPFTLLLRPLTELTQGQAYWVWVALGWLAGLLGTFCLMAAWPVAPRCLAAMAISLSPAALWNIRVGQVSMFLALSLGLAVFFLVRGRPGWAGVALSLGLVKPHLILPLALVLVLAASRGQRRPLVQGLVGGAVGWAIFTQLFDGGIIRYVQWLQGLGGSDNAFVNQADLAAIPGLLYKVFPTNVSVILTSLGVVLACFVLGRLALAAWSGGPWEQRRLLGAGISLYFAFLPYEHTSDQILLALPLLLLIGPDGAGLRQWPARIAAFCFVLTPLALFHDHTIEGFNVLPAVSLLLAYAVIRPSGLPGPNPLAPILAQRPALALAE